MLAARSVSDSSGAGLHKDVMRVHLEFKSVSEDTNPVLFPLKLDLLTGNC